MILSSVAFFLNIEYVVLACYFCIVCFVNRNSKLTKIFDKYLFCISHIFFSLFAVMQTLVQVLIVKVNPLRNL